MTRHFGSPSGRGEAADDLTCNADFLAPLKIPAPPAIRAEVFPVVPALPVMPSNTEAAGDAVEAIDGP